MTWTVRSVSASGNQVVMGTVKAPCLFDTGNVVNGFFPRYFITKMTADF